MIIFNDCAFFSRRLQQKREIFNLVNGALVRQEEVAHESADFEIPILEVDRERNEDVAEAPEFT